MNQMITWLIRGLPQIKYAEIRFRWFFWQPFPTPFLKPLKPFELQAGTIYFNILNLFWTVEKLKKSKKAQVINFLTQTSFKNAENQSRKGGSPEAPEHLNNHEWFTPLNKVLGFSRVKILVNSFLNSFLIWFLLEEKGVSTTPWTKDSISIYLATPK